VATAELGELTMREPSELEARDAPAVDDARRGGVELGPAERRLLAAMPLHAITSVYGEAGLRERLLLDIAPFPAEERERVRQALALAARLHAADRRQREPYVNHLLRVAIRIVSHYRVHDSEVACAALLHDAVEDHSPDLTPNGTPAAAIAALAGQFGDRVAGLVSAVTNPEWEPGRDRHEQYLVHVVSSLQSNPWARVIKASDFTDNAVGLIHTTGPKLQKLAAKYEPMVPVLLELILRPDTPLGEDVKQHIARQLTTAAHRFTALSPGGPPSL
jgi:hypothetical protein